MISRFLVGSGVVMLVALGAVSPAMAAETAPDPAGSEAYALDETGSSNDIIVTATKRSVRLQNVPASIVAESGDDLARRGAVGLQDIIDNTPGLNNPVAGARAISNITIRGVTTGPNTGFRQNTVAQLYDDITLDPVANGGTVNLRLVDVERVEVLRGPQGTLFGSGSLAGAIRYVTNKPDLNTLSAAAEGSIGFVRNGGTSGSGTATINVPLVADKLALRATGYAYRDGGWIDNLRTGRRNANYGETYGGRIALRWAPTEALTSDLTFMYQEARENATGASFYDLTGSNQVTDGRVDPKYRTRNIIGGWNLQYDFGAVALTSQTAYHDRSFRQRGQIAYYLPLTTGILSGFTNIVNGDSIDTSLNDAKVFTQEVRLASNGSGPFKWTVGGFFLNADFSAPQTVVSAALVPIAGSDNIVDVSVDGRQREIAGFGELSYTIGDKLDLAAGVRVSRVTIRNSVRSGGFLPVFSFSPAAYTQNEFRERNTPVTPHFSITYRPTESLSLYAAAARGFRVGGVNVTAGGRPIPQTYDPDSLWNYEVGAKGKLFDGALDYAISAYYIDWKDIQVSLQNNIGNYTGNAGSAHLYGVEFQAVARPTRELTLGGGFVLSNNELASNVSGLATATGVVNVQSGDLIAASSESQVNAFGEYRLPVSGGEVYLRASGRYVGPAWTGFAKAGSRFGDYTVADFRIGYAADRYELILFADNLFDSSGIAGANEATFAGPVPLTTRNAFRVQPRTIGATVRLRL